MQSRCFRQAGKRNEVAWRIKKYPGGHWRFNALWGTSVGFWLRIIQSKLRGNGNALRSKPSSPHSAPGAGDLCNGPLPNVRGDHNALGPILFPRFQEPIPESSPSDLPPTPVLEGNTVVRAAVRKPPQVGEHGQPCDGPRDLPIREHL